MRCSEQNIYDYCNISKERFELLYSFNNIYGVFKLDNNKKGVKGSLAFNLSMIADCLHNSTDAVLLDIIYGLKSGTVNAKANDVIAIKLEGKIFCYRYCGWDSLDSFISIDGFVNDEKQNINKKIHGSKMIVSVTDGKLFRLEELDASLKLYCISREVFELRNKKLVSNYSIYTLNESGVECVNPHGCPFLTMGNALFYFRKHKEMSKGKYNKGILLIDLHELERVRDYKDLGNVKLII